MCLAWPTCYTGMRTSPSVVSTDESPRACQRAASSAGIPHFLPSPNPHKHEGSLQGGQHGTLLGENIFRLTKLYRHGRECPAARGSSAGERGAYYDVHAQKYPRYETARTETVKRLETQDATCDASRVELRVISRAPNPPTRQHHRRPDGLEEHFLLSQSRFVPCHLLNTMSPLSHQRQRSLRGNHP